MSAFPVSGRFFDGQTAAAHAVSVLARDGAWLVLSADGVTLASWSLGDIEEVDTPARDGARMFATRGHPARLVLPARAALGAPPARRSRGWMIWAGGVAATALVVLMLVLPGLAPPLPFAVENWIGGIFQRGFIGDAEVCHDTDGQEALDRLAGVLAKSAGLSRPVTVTMIQSYQVNAFALPGNRIVILSGLADAAGDEAAFAGVLAHEVGHLQHGDPRRRLGRTLAVMALSELSGSPLAAWLGSFGVLRYERDAEARADAGGIELLHRAGLRADGLNLFLSSKAMRAAGSGLAWFSDHPATEERRAATVTDHDGADPLTPIEWIYIRSMCVD